MGKCKGATQHSTLSRQTSNSSDQLAICISAALVHLPADSHNPQRLSSGLTVSSCTRQAHTYTRSCHARICAKHTPIVLWSCANAAIWRRCAVGRGLRGAADFYKFPPVTLRFPFIRQQASEVAYSTRGKALDDILRAR